MNERTNALQSVEASGRSMSAKEQPKPLRKNCCSVCHILVAPYDPTRVVDEEGQASHKDCLKRQTRRTQPA